MIQSAAKISVKSGRVHADDESSSFAPKASVSPSYFVERGYRKMMLELLYDATHEMAKPTAGTTTAVAAAYQLNWLLGKTDSLLTAQFCFEAIAGNNEGAIEGLKRFCVNDPVGATKALHRVIVNFDCVLDKVEVEAAVMDVNPRADGSTIEKFVGGEVDRHDSEDLALEFADADASVDGDGIVEHDQVVYRVSDCRA